MTEIDYTEVAKLVCVVGMLTTPRRNRTDAPSGHDLLTYAAELLIAALCLLVPVFVAGALMGCSSFDPIDPVDCAAQCAGAELTDTCVEICGVRP